MIRSFRDKNTERIYHRGQVLRWGPHLQRAALRKLRILSAAVSLADLRSIPGNRLEKLQGDRAGEWSIRVTAQYRLCFRWKDGEAFEVELVNYH